MKSNGMILQKKGKKKGFQLFLDLCAGGKGRGNAHKTK